jgi:hypothetical protein
LARVPGAKFGVEEIGVDEIGSVEQAVLYSLMASCRNGGTEPRYGFFTPIRHRTFSPVAEKSYLRCPLFFGYLRFVAFGVLSGSRGFSESIFAGP